MYFIEVLQVQVIYEYSFVNMQTLCWGGLDISASTISHIQATSVL